MSICGGRQPVLLAPSSSGLCLGKQDPRGNRAVRRRRLHVAGRSSDDALPGPRRMSRHRRPGGDGRGGAFAIPVADAEADTTYYATAPYCPSVLLVAVVGRGSRGRSPSTRCLPLRRRTAWRSSAMERASPATRSGCASPRGCTATSSRRASGCSRPCCSPRPTPTSPSRCRPSARWPTCSSSACATEASSSESCSSSPLLRPRMVGPYGAVRRSGRCTASPFCSPHGPSDWGGLSTLLPRDVINSGWGSPSSGLYQERLT